MFQKDYSRIEKWFALTAEKKLKEFQKDYSRIEKHAINPFNFNHLPVSEGL